jgi:hypothetical protein
MRRTLFPTYLRKNGEVQIRYEAFVAGIVIEESQWFCKMVIAVLIKNSSMKLFTGGCEIGSTHVAIG